jgi:hypothetical protein
MDGWGGGRRKGVRKEEGSSPGTKCILTLSLRKGNIRKKGWNIMSHSKNNDGRRIYHESIK